MRWNCVAPCRGLATKCTWRRYPPAHPTDAAVDLDGVILHPLRTRPLVEQLDMLHWREVKTLAGQVGPDIIVERFYTFGGRGLRRGDRQRQQHDGRAVHHTGRYGGPGRHVGAGGYVGTGGHVGAG